MFSEIPLFLKPSKLGSQTLEVPSKSDWGSLKNSADKMTYDFVLCDVCELNVCMCVVCPDCSVSLVCAFAIHLFALIRSSEQAWVFPFT